MTLLDIQEITADSIRAVLADVLAASDYEWQEPANPFAYLVGLLTRFVDWLERLHELHPAVYWVILGFLTGILLAVIMHIGVLIWRALKPHALVSGSPVPTAAVRRDAQWHLDEWRRLRAAGLFAEALTHRFTALILQLERRKAVTFDPAKTPREYTSDAKLNDDERSVLDSLVGTLYRHVFGAMPCTEVDLEQFDLRAAQLGGWVAT